MGDNPEKLDQNKDPPNTKNVKRTTIKVNLNDFILPTTDRKKLESTIRNVNQLTFQVYLFLRLYILHKYYEAYHPLQMAFKNNPNCEYDPRFFVKSKFNLYKIDETFITACFNCLSVKGSRGRQMSTDTQKIYD